MNHGYCKCGCGKRTPLAKKTCLALGYRKGEPINFIPGHQGIRRPVIEDAAPFKIDGVYCRLVPLTRGIYSIVDADDYERLMKHSWQAHWAQNTSSYYATRRAKVEGKYRDIPMSREILGLDHNDPHFIDHRNGNSLDNRSKNLRIATVEENNCNARKRSDNSSGYKGVNWDAKSLAWRAQIQRDGHKMMLGSLSTPQEAYSAYCAAAKHLHGEFARVS